MYFPIIFSSALKFTICFCAVLATSSTALADTIKSVVNEVLAQHPEIVGLSLNRAAVEQEEIQARGLALPNVEVFGGTGYSRDDRNFVRGNSDIQSDIGLRLSQRIFDGYESKNRVLRQQARGQSARNRVRDAANTLSLSVLRAFLENQRAHAIHNEALNNIEVHKRLLRHVRESASEGRGTQTQVQQATAQLEQAHIDRETAELQVMDSETYFMSIVGRMPKNLKPVKLSKHHFPPSVDVAVNNALQQSPAVQAKLFDADAALAAIDVARADQFPKIDLEASAFKSFNEAGNNTNTYDTQALVRFRYNLFNGGINQAREREAELRAAEARNEVDAVRRIITRDVRLAYSQAQTSSKRLRLLRSKVTRGERILPDYISQFDVGRRSLLDILDIQNDIFTNRSAVVSERFAAQFNHYRIIALSGKLVEALQVEIPVAASQETLLEDEVVDPWLSLR